ncbi:MAG: hypothetical protein ABIA37_03470 [Candidatus Woesearchaeota archaeon]
MPTLIALLSAGKGTWTEVSRLISQQNWDKVFLITNKFGEENFNKKENTELVLVDAFKETSELAEQIKKQLKDKIKDFDVALNLASGSGKEHMALLKAVMELGLNFRLITIKENKLEML